MSRTSRQGMEVSHRKGPSSGRLDHRMCSEMKSTYYCSHFSNEGMERLFRQGWGTTVHFHWRQNTLLWPLEASPGRPSKIVSHPWPLRFVFSESTNIYLKKKKKDLKCVPTKIYIILLLEKKQRTRIPTCCGTWHVTAYGTWHVTAYGKGLKYPFFL